MSERWRAHADRKGGTGVRLHQSWPWSRWAALHGHLHTGSGPMISMDALDLPATGRHRGVLRIGRQAAGGAQHPLPPYTDWSRT
jgi:hypothetical protein